MNVIKIRVAYQKRICRYWYTMKMLANPSNTNNRRANLTEAWASVFSKETGVKIIQWLTVAVWWAWSSSIISGTLRFIVIAGPARRSAGERWSCQSLVARYIHQFQQLDPAVCESRETILVWLSGQEDGNERWQVLYWKGQHTWWAILIAESLTL